MQAARRRAPRTALRRIPTSLPPTRLLLTALLLTALLLTALLLTALPPTALPPTPRLPPPVPTRRRRVSRSGACGACVAGTCSPGSRPDTSPACHAVPCFRCNGGS